VPVHKYCAVYNLRFESFHGMEEVIGSIPIRSTKYTRQNSELRRQKRVDGTVSRYLLDQ
jgi:hypothetical protein